MTSPVGTFLRPRDALLHQPPVNEMTWLETNGISFFVPERRMRCHMPVKFRTNVGVVYSTIMVWSQECATYLDFDYYDAQVHLPMPPQNLDHYSLANGLTVRMTEPLKKFQVTYDGFYGTHIEFELEGLMPAIDSRETKIPDVGKDFSHFYPVKAMLSDTIGHIDQTMMVNGVLVLDGKEIKISGPSIFDHSWGPRPEYGHACGNYDEGYFGADGTDLAFHVQTLNDKPNEGTVINGYIIENGELHTLKAGVGHYELDGWVTRKVVYELEDDRGKAFRIQGDPLTTSRLPTLPNQWILAAFTKWTCDGEEGWGEYKFHWEVPDMVGTKDWTERPTTERRKA